MANSALVNVFDASYNLGKKSAGFCFLEPLSLHDVFEEFAARRVLHNQEQLS